MKDLIRMKETFVRWKCLRCSTSIEVPNIRFERKCKLCGAWMVVDGYVTRDLKPEKGGESE